MPKRRRKNTLAKRTKAAAPLLLPLPDDLVDDVFLRLPSRTLAVCRRVSRSWNRRLSSPAFARLYHHHRAVSAASASAAAAAAPVMFATVPADSRRRHRRRVAAWFGEKSPTRTPCEGCPRVFAGGGGKACHGLLLVGKPCKAAFAACNHFTGGAFRLPPRRPEWLLHIAGLGYDAAAGAHKAVLLERVAEDDLLRSHRRRRAPALRCVVVTVGGRQQRWRASRGRRAALASGGGAAVAEDVDPVFAAGRLHWMLRAPAADGSGAPGEPSGILSFSVGDESFTRVPLPPPSPDKPTQAMGELDGRLCVVRDLRRRGAGDAVFEVWKLGDRHESWSLDCRVDFTARLGRDASWMVASMLPLRYVGGGAGGELILLAAMVDSASAFIFDLGTGKLGRSKGVGVKSDSRLLMYQENALHIAGMEYGTEFAKFDRVSVHI